MACVQWNEFHRFAPGIKTVLYHGDPKKREELRRSYKLTNTAKAADCVVITTYEMVMNDRAKLQNLRYGRWRHRALWCPMEGVCIID
jgi:ATP-dependent DNA helicase